jgi:hypothetical protein
MVPVEPRGSDLGCAVDSRDAVTQAGDPGGRRVCAAAALVALFHRQAADAQGGSSALATGGDHLCGCSQLTFHQSSRTRRASADEFHATPAPLSEVGG